MAVYLPKMDQKALSMTNNSLHETNRIGWKRHFCCSSIAMQEDGASGHIAAGISDISLTGCYVELLTTLPIGTLLSLLLRLDGMTIRGTAEVRTAHPGVGMGLEFWAMGAADKTVLHQLINRLSGAAKS